jgi:hypothetical protein
MTELSLCTFHPPFSSPLTNGTNTGSKSLNQTRIVDGEQDRFRRWKYPHLRRTLPRRTDDEWAIHEAAVDQRQGRAGLLCDVWPSETMNLNARPIRRRGRGFGRKAAL